MKILVTGGAGYIGSHFCKTAAQAGHTVVAYDNLSTGHEYFVKFGPFVRGDIRTVDLLTKTMRVNKIEAVLHFAGKALVRESMIKPEIYFENNPYGTLCLLNAMHAAGVHNIVFSSSCSVYGVHDGLISETAAQSPINPYGQSKKQCEEILFNLQTRYHLRIAILRYFNVIGQDPTGDIWEDHEPETHILPNILKAEMADTPVSILGASHPTADGTCIRDYIDVRDLVKAHLAALDKLKASATFVSNVGQGIGTSLYQLLHTYESVFQTKVKTEIKQAHPGDPPHLVANATFFKSWYPHNLHAIDSSIQSLALRRKLS